MRRADRLFRLVQLLRSSRLVTAGRLAEELEVSERTVYRDVRDLTLSGVPIRGEAGVGYSLGRGFDLPPLMFTEEELEALVLGARVVQGYADRGLARAADSALAKIELVLPDALRGRARNSALMVPTFQRGDRIPQLGVLREALRSKARVQFRYVDGEGKSSKRTVRPLALAFWGKTWSMASWCEWRQDFRSFRVDRMFDVDLGKVFTEEADKNLDAFIRHVTQEMASRKS
jgi:predicted DNA-binding transcriptional regulator YafY